MFRYRYIPLDSLNFPLHFHVCELRTFASPYDTTKRPLPVWPHYINNYTVAWQWKRSGQEQEAEAMLSTSGLFRMPQRSRTLTLRWSRQYVIKI